jgi:hypothetical protein
MEAAVMSQFCLPPLNRTNERVYEFAFSVAPCTVHPRVYELGLEVEILHCSRCGGVCYCFAQALPEDEWVLCQKCAPGFMDKPLGSPVEH